MFRIGFIFILLLCSLQAKGKSLEMVQENLGRISISPYQGPDGNTEAGKGAAGIKDSSSASEEVFPFNDQVQLLVRLSPEPGVKQPRLSYFNVCMPHHNHCMKLQPRIEPLSGQENQWVVSGVKLHMDGQWQVTLKFTKNGGGEVEVNKSIFVSMPGAAGASQPSKVKPAQK